MAPFKRTLMAVAALVGVFALWFGVDWGFLKSEITAYPILCAEVMTDNQCLWPSPGRPTTYRVFPDQQTVLLAALDEPLPGCSVVDRTNWTCADRNGGTFGFARGTYFFTMKRPYSPDVLDGRRHHVSKWQYNWLRVSIVIP